MFNSINIALQNVTEKPAPSWPHRISDLIPGNREGSNEKGEFTHFLSDLQLWMQAWSDAGETMVVSAESTDKLDISNL